MPTPEPPQSTEDYRKYPKGPNFLGIVIGAAVVILILMAAFLLFLRKGSGKMEHIQPNPTPNSQVRPLLPQGDQPRLA